MRRGMKDYGQPAKAFSIKAGRASSSNMRGKLF
jgi:hypothetical protein